MRLINLRVQNFRNHVNSFFEFGDGANILLGDNGQGKTNVIEAISYLCLTKSFYANSDAFVVNFSSDLFEVEGIFMLDTGHEQNVRVAYDRPHNEKVVTINKRHVEPFSSVIGKFPIVLCSPEHAPITSGGPAERRRFVDFVSSQISALYFQDLIEYRRVIRHRNKILLDGKLLHRDGIADLEPWNEQLVVLGSHLMLRRRQFVEEFQQSINEAYHHIVGHEEEPTIEYVPYTAISSALGESELQQALRDDLGRKVREERQAGTSLVGPHRDELIFKINGLDLRKFGSQGQHKTFLVALKIGEFFFLWDRLRETPILLLDDVFSELDEQRSRQLLEFVSGLSQTFVTSTNPHLFDHLLSFEVRDRKFFIERGVLVEPHHSPAA